MPHSNKKFFYHLLAIATAGIWGTTFVATKTLLLAGLTPAEIFIYRFSLAYLCIIFIAGRQVFAKSWLDEIKMIAAGLTGGSVYFTTENTALEFTQASNVGILISITSNTPSSKVTFLPTMLRKPPTDREFVTIP